MSVQLGTLESGCTYMLVTLIKNCDAQYFSIPEPDDRVIVLEYSIEGNSLSLSDLFPYQGNKEWV